MKNIRNKKVVVTGGAMGIGFATVKRLLDEGCSVAVWDNNTEAIKKAKNELAEYTPKLRFYLCDISDSEKVRVTALETKRDMGAVDILINNAGTVTAGRFTSHPVESWDRLTQINLNSIYYTTAAFLPDMYERNSGQIVNISSGAGLVGLPDLAVYCATKWAVYGFTESLRLEAMADHKNGVRFSSVHPGILKKGLFEGSRMNLLGELLLPRVERHDDIARAVVNKALKKERCVVKKPWSLNLGQVARALLPDIILNRLLIMAGAGDCMKYWTGGSTMQTVKNKLS